MKLFKTIKYARDSLLEDKTTTITLFRPYFVPEFTSNTSLNFKHILQKHWHIITTSEGSGHFPLPPIPTYCRGNNLLDRINHSNLPRLYPRLAAS